MPKTAERLISSRSAPPSRPCRHVVQHGACRRPPRCRSSRAEIACVGLRAARHRLPALAGIGAKSSPTPHAHRSLVPPAVTPCRWVVTPLSVTPQACCPSERSCWPCPPPTSVWLVPRHAPGSGRSPLHLRPPAVPVAQRPTATAQTSLAGAVDALEGHLRCSPLLRRPCVPVQDGAAVTDDPHASLRGPTPDRS